MSHTKSAFLRKVDDYIRAGYQNLVIDSKQLLRVQTELMSLCEKDETDNTQPYDAVLVWDCVNGLKIQALSEDAKKASRFKVGDSILLPTSAVENSAARHIKEPIQVLDYLMDMQGADLIPFHNCIVILRNFHAYMKDITVAQSWQNAAAIERVFNTYREVIVDQKTKRKELLPFCHFPIILGTNIEIPKALESTVRRIEFTLPDINYMYEQFDSIEERTRQSWIDAGAQPVDPATPELREAICRMLLGMTSTEAADSLALCAAEHGSLSSEAALDTIEHEKCSILQMSSSLTYVKRKAISSQDNVGGFDLFKQWLNRIKFCYSKDAAAEKLDPARGVVLFGVPGSGKSLVGKVAAKILGLPLVVMDVGAIFKSHVGESEQGMNDAIKAIEAMQGVVVLIDEGDKLWGGAHDASGDSGTTRRVFGRFLNWLQEKKDGSFVIMTINRTNGLPPEFLRKGRFDDIFYTDLPQPSERRDIFKIHMKIRGLNPDEVVTSEEDWVRLIDNTNELVGSEIEEIVKQARLNAKEKRGTAVPTIVELMEEVIKVQKSCLARLDSANIEAIRKACAERARPVSSVQDVTVLPPAPGAKAVRRVSAARKPVVEAA